MKRLSLATLAQLPAAIGRPAYHPASIATGIVHFGPGAFHRAHQADYFDRLLASDPRWGIAAASLRTPDTIEALARQDGLCSLSILDEAPSTRVIGAHRAWLGPRDSERLAALLAAPDTHIVTTTVTEKGYCLDGTGELDLGHGDILHDIANPATPHSVIGWLVNALAARRSAQLRPFTVLCCDNMTGNGAKLRAAVLALAALRDADLSRWIADRAHFPDTMVDSITPASDAAFLDQTAARLGVVDDAAVQREGFAQWVIEGGPISGEPDLESVGVIRSSSVAGYERAKLRILNGAHSTLAYLGLALGHESVREAMTDAALAAFTERMVRQDVVPGLQRVEGLDPGAYTSAIFARFRNPAICHLLSQIAWDGSQKLPYRLLDTIGEARQAGRPIERLVVPIAAWMAFVHDRARSGVPIVDPLADDLLAAGGSAEGLVERLLAIRAIFPPALATDPEFRAAVSDAFDALAKGRIAELLAR